jgi:hypothetical protein
LGAVMVVWQAGQGPVTPAKAMGTSSWVPQEEQRKRIFDGSFPDMGRNGSWCDGRVMPTHKNNFAHVSLKRKDSIEFALFNKTYRPGSVSISPMRKPCRTVAANWADPRFEAANG